MSGVESAASLFDSDNSVPDLFTTLDRNDVPTSPFDDLGLGRTEALFGISTSPNKSDFFKPETTYAQHTVESHQSRGNSYELYNNSQKEIAEQGISGQPTGPSITNPSIELTPSWSTDNPNPYGSREYTPGVTNTTSTYVNNYTPHSYAPAPTYIPNTPASHVAPAYSNLPPPKHYPALSANDRPPGPNSVHSQPFPPASSTLVRPKLNNAYDPPFLPTKPKRTGRATADANLAYGLYQVPEPSVSLSREVVSEGYAGTYPQMNATLQPPIQSATSTVPNHRTGSPSVPPPKAHGFTPKSNFSASNSYLPGDEPLSYNNYSQPVISPTVPSDGNGKLGVSASGTPHSRNPHNTRIDSNSSLLVSEKTYASSKTPPITTPSIVPLPYTQPMQSPIRQTSPSKSPPLYTPHLSPQLTRTLKNDPYSPPARVNSFLPRTASPLQKQSLINEPARVATTVNLNGTAGVYTAPQRNEGIPFVAPEPEPLSPLHARESSPSLGLYAPSPSLVGANDPLARTSSRAPVVTFGFGGKIVTCFHRKPGMNDGFDVALSVRTSSEVRVRLVQQVLPDSVLNFAGPSYPGPLVSDPGSTSLSLVRTATSSQMKAKKSALTTYLLGRIEEINQALSFLSAHERLQAEHKLILVKLLVTLIENDGRFFGSPQAESAVRTALVPRLSDQPILQDGVSLQAAAYQTHDPDETPISVTSLRTSSLSKIEDFLLQGDRRQAFQYAVDRKLWAHAMIIASSIDKDAWKEVINDFLHQELTFDNETSVGQQPTSSASSKKTWESLRVTYRFFSGQGAVSVQEFAQPSSMPRSAGVLHPMGPSVSTATPRTPHFGTVQPVVNIVPENLSNWADAVAMMISSPPSPELNGALVALGDQLLASNWTEAAHVCYLLSPYVFSSQPPVINGLGAVGGRLTLLGTKNLGDVFRDPDALIFTEILEFAMSLLPSSKGQEPFHGLPHFQAYRFMKAIWLAEMGDVQLSSRYSEAIASSLSPSSPYTNSALLEQLSGLQQRLSGLFHGEKNSWISGKLTKPSFDSIGGWLEGRFTKLVTGENGSSVPSDHITQTSDEQSAGPFAHYSTISSAVPSSRSSPQPAFNHLPAPPASGNPPGTPAALYSDSTKPHFPLIGIASQTSLSPTAIDGGYPRSEGPHRSLDRVETSSSWDSSSTDKTPTATSFLSVQDDLVQANSDGFISLMDRQSFAFESEPPRRGGSSFAVGLPNDDEDLGLGNSKSTPKDEKDIVEQPEKSAQEDEKPANAVGNTPAVATNSGGSWFGRLFKRSDNASPAPVRANLGEEKSLYYDKELKRWVNKSGNVPSTPPALPPPPRAQTASPGMGSSKAPSPSSPALAPRSVSAGFDVPRPASAIDLTSIPPPRIRSNLAPPTIEGISGSPITPSSTPPPRPRSQGGKRNIRNRYVDVFQQEGSGTNSS